PDTELTLSCVGSESQCSSTAVFGIHVPSIALGRQRTRNGGGKSLRATHAGTGTPAKSLRYLDGGYSGFGSTRRRIPSFAESSRPSVPVAVTRRALHPPLCGQAARTTQGPRLEGRVRRRGPEPARARLRADRPTRPRRLSSG